MKIQVAGKAFRFLALVLALSLGLPAGLSRAEKIPTPPITEQIAARIALEAIALRYGKDLSVSLAGFAEEALLENPQAPAWRVTFTSIDGRAPVETYTATIDAQTGALLSLTDGEEESEQGGLQTGSLTTYPMQGEAALEHPIADLCHVPGPAFHSSPEQAAVGYTAAYESALTAIRALFDAPADLETAYGVQALYYFLPAQDAYLWRLTFTPLGRGEDAAARYVADIESPSGEVSGCWREDIE